MDFRQQLAKQKSTEREQALSEDIDILILENTKLKLEAKNWNFDNTNLQEANDHLEACVAELKAENTKLREDKEREKALDDENIHLQKVVIDLETFVEELQDDKVRLNRKVETLEAEVQELKDKVQGQPADIVQLQRDLTAKTAHANAWKAEAEKLRKELQNYESKQKLSKHE